LFRNSFSTCTCSETAYSYRYASESTFPRRPPRSARRASLSRPGLASGPRRNARRRSPSAPSRRSRTPPRRRPSPRARRRKPSENAGSSGGED
jgi:hypothetical protein